nr:amyloid fiber anchoring/assembly protein TapA [Bacillus sp. FJAT-49711]
MRRVEKYRKKTGHYSILLKLVIVVYLCIGIAAILAGETNAFFSNVKSLEGSIQAGTWETEDKDGCSSNNHGDWDCSSLEFVSAQYDGEVISAVIKNTGSDMQTTGSYEVYFKEKGNPKEGIVVSNLTFKPLKMGEQIALTFTPDRPGKYMFKAYQHKDHPGKGILWSDAITVKLTEKKLKSEEEQIKSENQEEVEPSGTGTEAKEPMQEETSEETKNSLTDVKQEQPKDSEDVEEQENNTVKEDSSSETENSDI